MNWKEIVRARLHSLDLRPERESEIVEELALHLESTYDKALAAGRSHDEAYRRAMEVIDDWRLLECDLQRAEGAQVADRPKTKYRNKRGMRMESIWQDLMFGWRTLRQKPVFTAIAVLTLALGIGANTAIFSVVYALLLRPLPYADSSNLVFLAEARSGFRGSVAFPNYKDWRERARSFSEMAAYRSVSFNLTGTDQPARLSGRAVHWNFFRLLGVKPQIGRTFAESDDTSTSGLTALLGHGLWKDRFGADPAIVGKTILLDGKPYAVIGVLPAAFEFFRKDDVYVTMEPGVVPDLLDRGNHFSLFALARLKEGVQVQQANSEMAGIAAQLEKEYPGTNSGFGATAEALQDVMMDDVRQSLWVLLAAVGFILLIACVNVVNLLLVRASERQRETAVRFALGAGRWRVVRLWMGESLLMALLGGASGWLVARGLLAGLLSIAPSDVPHLARVELNSTVLLFTLAVSVMTSLLCGVLPAFHASRTDLNHTLKEGGRSIAGVRKEALRHVLLVAEVALALVLLVGAGLMVRTMIQLMRVDPGFKTERLLTMRFILAGEQYEADARRAFFDECVAQVAALPGVRSAALAQSLPIEGAQWGSVFITADKPVPARKDLLGSAFSPVSANFFEAMGMRVLKGRGFTAADTMQTSNVTVINETLARRVWPGDDPIGKRLKQGFPEDPNPWREVVGVVADVKLNGVERATPLEAYLPLAQQPSRSVALIVRADGEPRALAPSIERTVHAIDKNLPVYGIRSMDELLGNALAQKRLTLVMLGGFATLALIMAAIGVYGVISYSVSQRQHELGLRVALGASRGNVLRLVLGQGLKLTITGVIVGLLAAAPLVRLMEKMLFNVRPTDPATYAVIAAVLVVVSLIACWVPARRATRVDPLAALREE